MVMVMCCQCCLDEKSTGTFLVQKLTPQRAEVSADIRALWRSAMSARVPECQELKM